MSYNIHPIVVHVPIVLLCIYSLIKIIPVKKWFPRVAWRDIELLVLVFGVLGALAALWTGDTAEHLYRPNRQLLEVHSTVATVATILYGLLLLGEIAAVKNLHYASAGSQYPVIKRSALLLEKIFMNTMFSIVSAIAALVALTLTGILGGAMVYGTTADPFAASILSIFGIQ